MANDSDTPIKILDFKSLRQICPLSRVHIGRLEKAGKFPRRVKISEARVGWISSEIDDFLRGRAALREGKLADATPAFKNERQ